MASDSSIYSSSQTLNNKKNQNASSIPIRRHSQNLPIDQTRPKLPPTRSVALEIPTGMDLSAVQSTNHHRRTHVLYGSVMWTGYISTRRLVCIWMWAGSGLPMSLWRKWSRGFKRSLRLWRRLKKERLRILMKGVWLWLQIQIFPYFSIVPYEGRMVVANPNFSNSKSNLHFILSNADKYEWRNWNFWCFYFSHLSL